MGYAITMGILLAYVFIGSFLSDDAPEEAEIVLMKILDR